MTDHSKSSGLGIKSWSVEDRPREKLLLKGRESLSNAELIAILLGTGTKNLSAVDVAMHLLNENENDLEKLSVMSFKQLCKQPGIGEAKAITIMAATELGRRRKASIDKKKPIQSSNDAYLYIYDQLSDLSEEKFFLILLSQASIPLAKELISVGGRSSTLVDPKVVFRKACENERAVSLILCHNHPSGNLKPSQSDIDLTNRLKEAARMLEFRILDHIIVGHHEYYSFADNGMI